jgi:hypothetical protein
MTKEERVKRKEERYQERTREQQGYFRKVFDLMRGRATRAAERMIERDRNRVRQRLGLTHHSFQDAQDLTPWCFRSRMSTAICDRLDYWELSDVERWLEMCGLGAVEAAEIIFEVERKIARKARAQGAIVAFPDPKKHRAKIRKLEAEEIGP